jgi:hypothetical protein
VITIKHGPLKQFGMDEGLTMVYRAADPVMLNAVKPGYARSCERPARHHKNREGAMRLNLDRGHFIGFAVAHGAAERKRTSTS